MRAPLREAPEIFSADLRVASVQVMPADSEEVRAKAAAKQKSDLY